MAFDTDGAGAAYASRMTRAPYLRQTASADAGMGLNDRTTHPEVQGVRCRSRNQLDESDKLRSSEA